MGDTGLDIEQLISFRRASPDLRRTESEGSDLRRVDLGRLPDDRKRLNGGIRGLY